MTEPRPNPSRRSAFAIWHWRWRWLVVAPLIVAAYFSSAVPLAILCELSGSQAAWRVWFAAYRPIVTLSTRSHTASRLWNWELHVAESVIGGNLQNRVNSRLYPPDFAEP